MRRSSLFYSITFIFLLASISIFLAFLWLMNYDKQNYTKELNTRYSIVSNATLYKLANLMSEAEYSSQMRHFNMAIIDDNATKHEIKQNATILQEVSTKLGTSAILLYNRHHFLSIKHENSEMLFQDSDYQPYRYHIIKVIFSFVFIIVLMAYIFTIRKIKPLRKLKRQIDKFAKGDLDIVNVSTGKDEISEVAEAFYQSVMQIKKLNHSRHLFLRNIMHELKTPITKGRITAEMLPEDKYQARLISVFVRLEDLINEFAAVEETTSGKMLSQSGKCNIKSLINEAIELAMIEEDRVEIQGDTDIKIKANFKLFSIAIKNIIDNGMKYSTDKKVKIQITKNAIEFHTLGEPLKQELEVYIEPFSKGEDAKNSFGLGLYIVDNIIKAHKLKFTHRYEEGFNIFSFEGLECLKTEN
ncbi:MAG: HAMP domain-containing histidine kinase [Campylobacteraceae bacterium]|nr:HAMP domain-containing histidine kinase [Campylobacteraceae bacterium]